MSAMPIAAAGPCPASRSRRMCSTSQIAINAACAIPNGQRPVRATTSPVSRRWLAMPAIHTARTPSAKGLGASLPFNRSMPPEWHGPAAGRYAALLRPALLLRMGIDDALQRRRRAFRMLGDALDRGALDLLLVGFEPCILVGIGRGLVIQRFAFRVHD